MRGANIIPTIILICLFCTAPFVLAGPAVTHGSGAAIAGQIGESNGQANADGTAKKNPEASNVSDSGNFHHSSIPASVADSAIEPDSGGESEAARMYRSSVSGMRRDAPQMSATPDTLLKKRRAPIPDREPPKISEPKAADSLSPDVKGAAHEPLPQAKTKVKKNGIIIALGSCALIGCGIALYFFTDSKKDDTVSKNNRIPPPPDPPL